MRLREKMKTWPLISIIVPVYNVERDLDRCVHSLVSQTYSHIELILVDDGSTDSSGSLCDKWAKKDTRIQVVHKKNGGLSSARNAGIDIAHGDFIGFVDSDDYVERDMYKEMLSCFTSEDVSFVCCGRFVHMGTEVKEEFSAANRCEFDKEKLLKGLFLGKFIDVSACDKLYRNSLFSTLRYPEGRTSEDAAIILQIVERTYRAVHVGKSFYHYVFRSGSISKAAYSHANYDVLTNCIEMRDWVERYNPSLTSYFNSYCCVQMAGVLQNMYISPGARKKWKNDYREYRSLFDKCFNDYLRTGDHKRNELARIVATRVHIYWIFKLFREIKKRIKNNVK